MYNSRSIIIKLALHLSYINYNRRNFVRSIRSKLIVRDEFIQSYKKNSSIECRDSLTHKNKCEPTKKKQILYSHKSN